MLNLLGKVVVITGSGAGIGKKTAIRFAEQGASVVCADIKDAHKTAEEIRVKGHRALGIHLNVTNWTSWQNLLLITSKQFGDIDILCGFAGISENIDIIELSEAQFDKQLNINVKGVYFGMKAVLPQMIKKKSGYIVNVASLAVHRGLAGLRGYSASEDAVISLSQKVALQYSKYNIQVNVLSPFSFRTKKDSVFYYTESFFEHTFYR